MIKFVKQYYPEFLSFGVILTILMIDLNPDFTFINKAADSIGYIYSAQYLYPSYHTSPPLYLLVSHFFLMLPFGTEAWRMGLVSVLSTMGACVFIYLIITRSMVSCWADEPWIKNSSFYENLVYLRQRARLFGILGILIYGLSALVISQSIIVNTYATTCMLASGAYYFAVTKHWKLMGLMIGIGLAVHLLMGFVLMVLLIAYKEYRTNWKALVITFSFIIFYIYIPLTNRPPYMWLPDPSQVNTMWATITDVVSVINMLIGSLSIWDLPKRIFDIIGVMGVSIGVITIFPLVYYFKKSHKFWRNPLFWLILVPIVLFMGELDMNTFDYMMIAMPFISVAICLGLSQMVTDYGFKARIFATATLVIVLGLGIFNCIYFDIGRTLDSNLSATKLYREEFDKIPDGSIFMPNYAWEWEAIYKYKMDTGKDIYPICIDVLPSSMYQQTLIKDGIVMEASDNENISIKASEMAKSIALLNENVWTTVSVDPRTFGSEVIPVNRNPNLVANVDRERIEQITNNPQIQWKPYNPYEIMTTEIFIEKWNYLLYSNWNVRFFASWASIGLIIMWLFNYFSYKRKMADEVEE